MGEKKMTIAIDFDGTCVTHDFPNIGDDIGAAPVLRELVANGHKLILWTVRSDQEKVFSPDPMIQTKKAGKFLLEAVKWFKKNKIPLFGINSSPTQKSWSESPKAYAELYIDDAALGCSVIYDPYIHHRPFADWTTIHKLFIEQGLIKPKP